MKSTGVARKIDNLGRVVLPVEIRRRLGLREGTYLEIEVDEAKIVLTKVEDACVFCGSEQALRPHRERWACAGCVAELARPRGGHPDGSPAPPSDTASS